LIGKPEDRKRLEYFASAFMYCFWSRKRKIENV